MVNMRNGLFNKLIEVGFTCFCYNAIWFLVKHTHLTVAEDIKILKKSRR